MRTDADKGKGVQNSRFFANNAYVRCMMVTNLGERGGVYATQCDPSGVVTNKKSSGYSVIRSIEEIN